MAAAPISLTLTRDDITPRLNELVSDDLMGRMLDAAGTLIGSMATRAFSEPSLRPTSWPGRKDKLPHPLLIKSTDLSQSIHHKVRGDEVIIGSAKEDYAGVQQLGSRNGRIPARPYFPVLNDQLTGNASAELGDVLSVLVGKAGNG
jgi:phage gpG-like protein